MYGFQPGWGVFIATGEDQKLAGIGTKSLNLNIASISNRIWFKVNPSGATREFPVFDISWDIIWITKLWIYLFLKYKINIKYCNKWLFQLALEMKRMVGLNMILNR